MNIKMKDQYFKETVKQLKEWGFEVYSPSDIFESSFRYGWVTDKTNILYFQIDDLEGLQFSIQCIPSKETGSGCRVKIDFTKEGILKGFGVMYGKSYPNFEAFRRNYWDTLIQL